MGHHEIRTARHDTHRRGHHGPALAALTIAAAASASSAPAMAPGAKGCVKVTATIGVGSFPLAVAADPKTNT
jgi:hypothetical protein